MREEPLIGLIIMFVGLTVRIVRMVFALMIAMMLIGWWFCLACAYPFLRDRRGLSRTMNRTSHSASRAVRRAF